MFFDLFKVIFWNSDDPFSIVPGSLHSKPDYEIFHFFYDFFPLFFQSFEIQNSSDFFILDSMFHPSYKDLDTCLHRWRRQRTRLTGNGKYSEEVIPKNQLSLLLFS